MCGFSGSFFSVAVAVAVAMAIEAVAATGSVVHIPGYCVFKLLALFSRASGVNTNDVSRGWDVRNGRSTRRHRPGSYGRVWKTITQWFVSIGIRSASSVVAPAECVRRLAGLERGACLTVMTMTTQHQLCFQLGQGRRLRRGCRLAGRW